MQRIPEPELMLDPAQARAYAEADFAEPHEAFVARFRECFPDLAVSGQVLDLGCGPGDVAARFARAFPACSVDGIDGSAAMLAEGERLLALHGVADRVRLHRCLLPDDAPPNAPYDGIISNSLLHHLHEPAVLWRAIRDHARAGAFVYVMDLMRPDSPEVARALVERYSGDEPEVLRHDFYHSLLAAFSPDEV
ncbi:MAG: class I SAM-dependent methyltransferase, partial [Chromatiales bacterium]|nr:class I SAM-dependent methyltransferase [Chromatiales bacterium]